MPLRKRLCAVLGIAVLCAAKVWACGPYYPYGYIEYGDELGMLDLPACSFAHDLKAITGAPIAPAYEGEVHYGFVADSLLWKIQESTDLTEALSAQGADQIPAIVGTFMAFREAMHSYTRHPKDRLSDAPVPSFVPFEVFAGASNGLMYPLIASSPPPLIEDIALPPVVSFVSWEAVVKVVPAEFALYGLGAEAYAKGDLNGALSYWRQLLTLPADQRQYRSVCAAYMIGRTLLHFSPWEADMAFDATLRLTGAGHRDPLNLSVTANRWRASIAESRKDYVAAVYHLLDVYRHGNARERTDALAELHIVFGDILAADPIAPDAVADPMCRALVSASLLDGAGTDTRAKWLEAARGFADGRPIGGADRLAWVAYDAGRMDEAASWAKLAGPDAPLGQWVKSKLLLREGKVREAVEVLSRVAKTFSKDETWEIERDLPEKTGFYREANKELGILRLGQQDYVDALDALLRSDYWLDAAYVAERVLGVDELKAYVDRLGDDAELAASSGAAIGWYSEGPSASTLDELRWLLARRLARANRWKDAMPYYVDADRVNAEKLCGFLDDARTAKTPEQKGQAYFDAALTVREFGLKLLGTELDPDWHVMGGRLSMWPIDAQRLWPKDGSNQYYVQREGGWEPYDGPLEPVKKNVPAAVSAAVSPSPDEVARIKKHAITPQKRFHYRYTAADLMWKAAGLWPDNDLRTAKALYTGGKYIADKDPGAADRFYKALVRRCGNLEIGKEANRLHWFPDVMVPETNIDLLDAAHAKFKGVVVDQTGKPVERAEIFTAHNQFGRLNEELVYHDVRHPIARTDATGRFIIADLPQGMAGVIVNKEDYGSASFRLPLPEGNASARLELNPYAQIRGNVKIAGKAAEVSILVVQADEKIELPRGEYGHFELPRMCAGKRYISIRIPPKKSSLQGQDGLPSFTDHSFAREIRLEWGSIAEVDFDIRALDSTLELQIEAPPSQFPRVIEFELDSTCANGLVQKYKAYGRVGAVRLEGLAPGEGILMVKCYELADQQIPVKLESGLTSKLEVELLP